MDQLALPVLPLTQLIAFALIKHRPALLTDFGAETANQQTTAKHPEHRSTCEALGPGHEHQTQN